MAIARFQLPDGRVARFEVPEGTTPEQAQKSFDQWNASQAPQAPKPTVNENLNTKWVDDGKTTKGAAAQGGRDLGLGALKGASDIGATLLMPVDYSKDLYKGDKLGTNNRQRRDDVTSGLETLGADPSAGLYSAGRLATQIAGTAGAGPAIGGGAKAIPLVAKSPKLMQLVNAIETGGLNTGANPATFGAKAVDLGVRSTGGAVAGGTQAAMINPIQTREGATIGAVMPVGMKVAGKVGSAIGSTVRGPVQPEPLKQAIKTARDAGYVIPPSQANPTMMNRLVEGLSGKITTAQNASAKNQIVTNKLIANALGLPEETMLSPDLLSSLRSKAGDAYSAIGNAGTITPGQTYAKALDAIDAPYKKAMQGFPNAKPSPVLALTEELRSPAFDSASAIEKIKQLRSAADDAFRSGNSDIGRASKQAAKALEDAIEDHLTQSGNAELLKNFRDARQLIAKTYSVEKALNPTSGSVDAKKLAGQLAKGKPLSAQIKTVADFAAQFPKAAQTVEQMGSLPQLSPLDYGAGALGAAATGNPAMLGAVVARPMARSLALSPVVQNRLVQAPQGQQTSLQKLLDMIGAEQALYRSTAPIVADR